MPLPRELALTPEELDEMMLSEWNMRIATIGPGSRINLTPLWFMWVNGKIYFHARGQKIVNLRRNRGGVLPRADQRGHVRHVAVGRRARLHPGHRVTGISHVDERARRVLIRLADVVQVHTGRGDDHRHDDQPPA